MGPSQRTRSLTASGGDRLAAWGRARFVLSVDVAFVPYLICLANTRGYMTLCLLNSMLVCASVDLRSVGVASVTLPESARFK